MAKYRLLTREELEGLEKEFVEYLVVNGITADDWERMKANEKAQAERILDLFSDVVWEGILRKVQYLEYRAAQQLHAFQCLPDKLVLVAMEAGPDSGADFNDADFIATAAQQPPQGLRLYTTDKPYQDTREAELFALIQSGCTISDGQLYKTLCLALAAGTPNA
ncbi:MAG: DUF6495 family protein [Bacteroidota bacterium]